MAFIDSGAAGNFMDFTLASQLKIQPITLHDPLTVTALDGRPLGSGQVSQCTTFLHFQVGSHREGIQFFLINSPEFPLILGYPWIVLHNPRIDWSSNQISEWGPNCCASGLSLCHSPEPQTTFPKLPEPSVSSKEMLAISGLGQVASSDLAASPESSRVPHEYADLCDVFSKERAASLPPHRPYDCAIELHPGTCPPRGRLFSLSSMEHLWKNISTRHLTVDSSALQPHRQEPGSSLWGRRMAVSGHVLTTGV